MGQGWSRGLVATESDERYTWPGHESRPLSYEGCYMNAIDTRLTLPIARRMLELIGDGRIPIKVSAAHCKVDRKFWTKARLVGIKGNNILYRPLNNHSTDESAPVEKVKIWQSRLNPRLREVLTQAVADCTIPIVNEPKITFVIPTKLPISIPPISIEVPMALEPGHTPTSSTPTPNPQPTIPTQPIVQPISQKAPNTVPDIMVFKPTPSVFIDLIKQYEDTRRRLEIEAATSGQMALDRLFSDRECAVKMVEAIDHEIEVVKSFLAQFGPKVEVPIPELTDEDHAIERVKERVALLMQGLKRSEGYKIREEIMTFLCVHAPGGVGVEVGVDGWVDAELLAPFCEGRPVASVINPLVNTCVVIKRRTGRKIEYKLADHQQIVANDNE